MNNYSSLFSKSPIYLAYFVLVLTILTFPLLIFINYSTFIAGEKVKTEALELEKLIGKAVFYDEALTMSASMAFATGDLKWKNRYNQYVTSFERVFAKLIKVTPYSKAGLTLQNSTNTLFILEKKGFNLLKAGKNKEALNLLKSASYENHKRTYIKAIDALIQDIRFLSDKKLNKSKKYSSLAIFFYAGVFLVNLAGWVLVTKRFKNWRKLVISVTKEDNKINWVNNGLTQLDEIMRSNLENPTKLFSLVLNFLAHYLGAGNGAIFKSYSSTANNIVLKPVASYGSRIELIKKIKLGEGLLGQAALERKTLLIDTVPDNYINISTGLGEMKPKKIIILPIIFEPNLKGVIELAFLGEIENFKITFLDKAVRAIAATMVILARKKETEKLLLESQKLTNQLQENEEELKVQHEELLDSNLRLEKMRKAKEDFLAHMSHEIRTPVNNIIGLSGLFKNSPLNHHQNHLVHLLDVSSKSLSDIINDLLDLSKLEAGKLKIVRTETDLLAQVNSLSEIMGISAENKGLTLITEIDPAIPKFIFLDGLRLNQVLMNLLSNAIKFTKAGSITLSVKELARMEELIQLEFAVTDMGIGMKPEAINRVFNSYEQAEDTTSQKFGGTGLGLSIVKSLVELDGGELFVKSQEQIGSVFSFTNWYQIAPTPKARIEQIKNERLSIADISILVVEDNSINQHLITHLLKKWGCGYKVVEEGGQALEELEQNHYDLILMDNQMDGMSGLDATLTIRKKFREPKRSIPIISLSSSVLAEEQQAVLDAGANAIVSKPFDHQVLLHKIKELLNF